MTTGSSYHSDLPAIEGINFRSICLEDDLDAIYALRVECGQRDKVDLLSASEGLPSREELRAGLSQASDTKPSKRLLIVEVKGQIVGYSQIISWHEDDGCWVYLLLGWITPAWCGQGIGTFMIHWGEGTAQELAAEEHPGERFEFAANASSTQPEATGLLLQEGYSAEYTVLELGLDFSALPLEQPLPAGIEVRPVLPEHLPLIASSMAEAYQGEYTNGRFQETLTLEESATRLNSPRQNPSLWKIAWAGQQVVGQVIPVIENNRALMYDISIRPAWRRQGLARALLIQALWDLRGRGIEVIRINTVAEFRTRARDLYTSVGFRVFKEFPRYRKSPA
jgi:mycothiol synthase